MDFKNYEGLVVRKDAPQSAPPAGVKLARVAAGFTDRVPAPSAPTNENMDERGKRRAAPAAGGQADTDEG